MIAARPRNAGGGYDRRRGTNDAGRCPMTSMSLAEIDSIAGRLALVVGFLAVGAATVGCDEQPAAAEPVRDWVFLFHIPNDNDLDRHTERILAEIQRGVRSDRVAATALVERAEGERLARPQQRLPASLHAGEVTYDVCGFLGELARRNGLAGDQMVSRNLDWLRRGHPRRAGGGRTRAWPGRSCDLGRGVWRWRCESWAGSSSRSAHNHGRPRATWRPRRRRRPAG